MDGIGFGSLIVCLTPVADSESDQWPLFALCLVTFVVGLCHVMLEPVPEDLKEQFRQAFEGKDAELVKKSHGDEGRKSI